MSKETINQKFCDLPDALQIKAGEALAKSIYEDPSQSIKAAIDISSAFIALYSVEIDKEELGAVTNVLLCGE